MIKRKNKTGLLASEMNGILAELTDDQKSDASRKFREAKEKTYDNVAKGKDERVNPDFSKEEREFISDEIDKATYNGKYSGRDKKDDVTEVLSKLNNLVETINNKLKSSFDDKFYCGYAITPKVINFCVYKKTPDKGSLSLVDWPSVVSIERGKDDNNKSFNNLLKEIDKVSSNSSLKYADILKDCVKELEKTDDESAVEKEN